MTKTFDLEAVRPSDIFSANLQDVLMAADGANLSRYGKPECYYIHGPGIETGELVFFPDRGRGWLYADGMSYNLRGETAFDLLERWQEGSEQRG
jgi:hypothetical protein